ncbi:hypothetical protein [Corynebacterium sp. A21]|uniref:hypothetical protein n=1 Tax=Corynebacterium sp. A21 TaxID=3457318 RepID=UPI003FCEFDAA
MSETPNIHEPTSTKIHLSRKPTINGQRVAVGVGPIAIVPIGSRVAVTLTLHASALDIDWTELPDSVEIIAPEDVLARRAAAIESHDAASYRHETVLTDNTTGPEGDRFDEEYTRDEWISDEIFLAVRSLDGSRDLRNESWEVISNAIRDHLKAEEIIPEGK